MLARRTVAAIVFFAVIQAAFHLSVGEVISGLSIGGLYGIIGVALVLCYRTSRVINFAAAAVGAVPAITAILLSTSHHISYLLTMPIAIVGGAGTTGRRVAERLTARGVPVRLASRTAATRFDWDDRATWGPALAGARAAYVAYAPDLAVPGAADAVAALADIALDNGVRRLVLLSGRGEDGAERAGAGEDNGHGFEHRRTLHVSSGQRARHRRVIADPSRGRLELQIASVW